LKVANEALTPEDFAAPAIVLLEIEGFCFRDFVLAGEPPLLEQNVRYILSPYSRGEEILTLKPQ